MTRLNKIQIALKELRKYKIMVEEIIKEREVKGKNKSPNFKRCIK